MITLYVAGPMTGLPQFNVPLFNEVAAKLRDDGYTVINPAELDSPEMQKQALASPDGNLANLEKLTNETWGDVLARDVKVIADSADAIVCLPGWYKSRGARLEVFVGLLTGKTFWGWSLTNGLIAADREHIRRVVQDNMP